MVGKGYKKLVLRWMTTTLLFIIFLFILLALRVSQSPEKEFDAYHSELSEVRSLYPDLNKNDYFTDAEHFRDIAFVEWQNQNRKCVIRRNYNESKRLILMAKSIVEITKKNLILGQDSKQESTDSLRFKDNDLSLFERREATDYSKWDKWINDALNYSGERKAIVLLIDKFNHRCLVVENGKLIADYLIEIGVKYLNNKQYKGDHATPEGSYYITSKRTSSDPVFQKVLLINFPNSEDIARLKNEYTASDKNSEVIIDKIKIHGNGGKGYDWTDGSIALTDKDFGALFDFVKVGTRVVIVGKIPEKFFDFSSDADFGDQ